MKTKSLLLALRPELKHVPMAVTRLLAAPTEALRSSWKAQNTVSLAGIKNLISAETQIQHAELSRPAGVSSALLLGGRRLHAGSDLNHGGLASIRLFGLLAAQGRSQDARGDGAAAVTLQLHLLVGVRLFL